MEKHMMFKAMVQRSGRNTITSLVILIFSIRKQCKNIYTYSFALYPEKQQPSGSCNMSKFTSINLYLDYSTINRTGYNLILKVYAVNYNILRIMSGMGGLSFSN